MVASWRSVIVPPTPAGTAIAAGPSARPASVSRCLDRRHDAGLQGLGKVGPCIHDSGVVTRVRLPRTVLHSQRQSGPRRPRLIVPGSMQGGHPGFAHRSSRGPSRRRREPPHRELCERDRARWGARCRASSRSARPGRRRGRLSRPNEGNGRSRCLGRLDCGRNEPKAHRSSQGTPGFPRGATPEGYTPQGTE